MFNIANLATDKDKEKDGIWVDFPGGLRLHVRRAENNDFKRFVSGKRRELAQVARMTGKSLEELTDEDVEPIVLEGVAEYILLGWDGMTEPGPDGPVTVEPTLENRIRILRDYPEFRKLVDEASTDFRRFRAEYDAKNLGN